MHYLSECAHNFKCLLHNRAKRIQNAFQSDSQSAPFRRRYTVCSMLMYSHSHRCRSVRSCRVHALVSSSYSLFTLFSTRLSQHARASRDIQLFFSFSFCIYDFFRFHCLGPALIFCVHVCVCVCYFCSAHHNLFSLRSQVNVIPFFFTVVY